MSSSLPLGQKKFNREKIGWWLKVLPLSCGLARDGISLAFAEEKKWLFLTSWGLLIASVGLLGWQSWRFYQAWLLPQSPERAVVALVETEEVKKPRTYPQSTTTKVSYQAALARWETYQSWQKLQPADPQLNYNIAVIEANR